MVISIHTCIDPSASLDGYAFNQYGRRGVGGWPGYDPERFDGKDKNKRICTIRRDQCFSITGPPTASAIFKHIAFDKPHCGDCSTCTPFRLVSLF